MDRLDYLFREPEVLAAPRLIAVIEAWRRASVRRDDDAEGWPTYVYRDPRSGKTYAWGVGGWRVNGLTGWTRVEEEARPSSWRVDLQGRVHRGLPWQRAHAAAVPAAAWSAHRALEALVDAEPGSPAWVEARALALAALGRTPT